MLWAFLAHRGGMMRRPSTAMARLLVPLGAFAIAGACLAQSADHVTLVSKAFKSAYAVVESTNGCPRATEDMFGWPKEKLLHCEYAKDDIGLGHKRAAVVWLLDVSPERVALWIESACAKLATPQPGCFAAVLKRGRGQSGYMFAVTGNVIEDMGEQNAGRFKNYFFRNGMTTSFRRDVNGSTDEMTLAAQRELALAPSDKALAIPSGKTRFFSTEPAHMAARFPDAGVPPDLRTQEHRLAWLGIVQREILAALDSANNRLLEAWLCAEPPAELGASCTPVTN
jgi:hypothetical protein